MSAPVLFDHTDFGQVRLVDIDGDPWFVAADICRVLEHSNSRMAVASLDEDEKGVSTVDTPGGAQQVTVISEPGLYALLARSRRPEARAFDRWVRHEVLPAIRRTGTYSVAPQLELPQDYLSALKALTSEVEARQEADRRAALAEKARVAIASHAADLEPKADAYDAFLSADGTYSVGAVAKMHGLSQNKLFDLLRNSGVLIAKGCMRNTPYQQYMHHFRVTAYDFQRSDGTSGSSYTTTVQPSGVEFVRRKLGLTRVAVAS